MVPLWAPQAYRGLLPSPSLGSGLVFIYLRVWGARRLGWGAALALPPLPFPGSWYLPPPANSGQTSSRPAEPATQPAAMLSPAWLWPWDPGTCYPAVAEEGETLCQKLLKLIATQFASTSM